MQSNGTSGEHKINSWQQIKSLMASGVTSTKDLCHHTGLSIRRVQEARKTVKDQGPRLAELQEHMTEKELASFKALYPELVNEACNE